MKPIRFFLAAFSVFLLFSCQQETLEQQEEIVSPVTGEGSEEGLVKLEFSAALEDESRTWLDGTAVKWRGTDKIAVIDNTSPYVHVFDNTDVDGGARCRFIGEAGDAASWPVVYPYSAFTRKGTDKFYVTFPAVQTAVTGGFANDSYITGAVATGKSFTMTPLCSMIKFTLAYNNIKQIFIEANLNSTFTGTVRPLAGTFIVDVNHLDPDDIKTGDDHPEYSSGRSGITLNPPAGETTFPAGDYYVPIADFTSRYGNVENMRLTFTRQDNETASRSITNATGDDSFAFERGKYTDFGMVAVDEGLSWEYYDIVFAVPGEGHHNDDTYLRWPFASWKASDDGDSWTDKADPTGNINALRTSIAWDIEGKLKDSGHTLRMHAETGNGEQLRYANQANGLYLNGHVGSYIEFPAMPNRHLMRVIVDYDATSASGGFPYMKGYSAAACPHIQTTGSADVDYTLTRDADGFYHDYNLYGTTDNTAYRYVISHDLERTWSGPRIQRIRLYYSKETRSLTLPEPTLSVISTTLRQFENTLTLTGADGAYDMGIVVRHALETAEPGAPEGHSYDRVIPVPVTPTVDGDTQTYVWSNSLAWSVTRTKDELSGNDPGLSEENQVYAYVRKFGCTTDPRDMDPASSGEGWRTSALTRIDRPDYDWSGTSSDLNYVYSSDTQVKLSATFKVTAGATQAYDYGFIYKLADAEDIPANWNYTKLDQNGTEKANITGYTLASGASQDISATLTGLTPGETYVYRPVAVQHLACKFDDGTSGESEETYHYKYIPRESTDDPVTMAGPVITTATTEDHSAYYTEAQKGQVTHMNIHVSHLDPDLYAAGAKFTTGIMYYSTHLSDGAWQYYRTRYDRKTIGTGSISGGKITNGVFSDVIVYGSTIRFLKSPKSTDNNGYLTVADVDGEEVHYRPYFAFITTDGEEGSLVNPDTEGYKYVMASDWGTFTCPVVSASGGDYLWRAFKTSDLKGTIGIDANGANCKMEIGYSTDNGNTWTTARDNITTTGEQTISSATLASEGPQTVKFGVRRHGSSDASTWKPLSITLAHPIASVYTYGSSYWEGNNNVTVAGSYTLNKVADNACVEYGVRYYVDLDKDRVIDEGTETLLTETGTGTGSTPPAYVQLSLTTGVDASTSSETPIRYWFFVRLSGSSASPDAPGTDARSSRASARPASTFGFGTASYSKRVVVSFSPYCEHNSGGYVSPFLPAAGYVSTLENGIAGPLCQSGSALLAGGHTLTFSLGSGDDHYSDEDHPLSGVLYNNVSDSYASSLRIYSNSLDDYIGAPAIPGVRVKRASCMVGYVIANEFSSKVTNPSPAIFYATSDHNFNSVGGGNTTIAPSMDRRDVVTAFGNAKYSTTYNGQSLQVHLADEKVITNTWPSKKTQQYEVRIRYIVFDYNGD